MTLDSVAEAVQLVRSHFSEGADGSYPNGWCGGGGHALEVVASTAAGLPGDHLEIGALWGATAIVAALAKKLSGTPGRVVCIDPMEYVHYEVWQASIRQKITPEVANTIPTVVMRNAEALGVELELVRAPSQPWPVSGRFSSVLIDGWHEGEMPYLDIMSAMSCSDLVMVDDANIAYPSVLDAIGSVLHDGAAIVVWAKDNVVALGPRDDVRGHEIRNRWSY